MSRLVDETPVRALVCTGPGALGVQDLPRPSLAALGDGGLGQVLAAGVCGSDLALLRGSDVAQRQWPLILGHETVVCLDEPGRVSERWAIAPGQRAYVEEFIPCGWCEACRGGRSRLCPRTDFRSSTFLRYGRTSVRTEPGLWGGFADTMYLDPRARLHPVADHVPSEVAVLATPVANGLRWVGREADVAPGDTVVVLGPGAHGLGCVVAAREQGARVIALIGLPEDARRLEAGIDLGAEQALVDGVDDVEAAVRSASAGRGADVVVDVTGAPASVTLAVELAAPFARIVLAGGAGNATPDFPAHLIVSRELTVRGVRGHTGADLERALGLIASGRHPLERISTTPVALNEAGDLLVRLATGREPQPAAHHVIVPRPDGAPGAETTDHQKEIRPCE